MSNEQSTAPQAENGMKLQSWLTVVVIVAIIGLGWWQNNNSPESNSHFGTASSSEDDSRTAPLSSSGSEESAGPSSSHRDPSAGNTTSNETEQHTTNPRRDSENGSDRSYKVENQTIRDLNGKVVFKGTIDLTPTLDRIQRGEANHHRNDGTSFQNREGRLPRKPAGYYKEYVHPTPGENGPGPQRIIIGKVGDTWYTSDHYKSFQQIKSADE